MPLLERQLALRGDGFVIRRLPFADKQFDLVICSHSFHHYPDQLAA